MGVWWERLASSINFLKSAIMKSKKRNNEMRIVYCFLIQLAPDVEGHQWKEIIARFNTQKGVQSIRNQGHRDEWVQPDNG